ncbi:IFN protein, partial [Alectura lathami]|nr:IFN protein [Alectura lathami]
MPVPIRPQRQGLYSVLLLLPALATAFTCKDLTEGPQDATFSWNNLQLLHAMAPSMSQPCPHQHKLFPFPETLLDTHDMQQAAITAQNLLQHLFRTLSSPNTPAHWIDRAHQRLLNHIDQYVRRLQRCLGHKAKHPRRRGPRNLHLSINKYFSRIHHFLQHNNYSPCAWDHVLLQAHACFRRVDTL